MEFDIKRVYTAVNADEVKVGSKVIIAKNISGLRDLVYNNMASTLTEVYSEDCQDRFHGEYEHKCGNGYDTLTGSLCYLISEPEEKKLKWTDLKIGDVISHKTDKLLGSVTGIDSGNVIKHICVSNYWLNDKDLEKWEKVE